MFFLRVGGGVSVEGFGNSVMCLLHSIKIKMNAHQITKHVFKPRKDVSYFTFEKYQENLLKMTPFQFYDHYQSINQNIVNGTISPDLVRAFEVVKPIQQAKLEIALKEREIEEEAPRVLSDDEKLVENGTHIWHCETEKCGGKGQTRQVWSLKKVE